MSAPAGKSPQHKLTKEERRRCLEQRLSERHMRRLRRADGKASAKDEGYQKKAPRKKAAKHTTPAMEVAQNKGSSPDRGPSGGGQECVGDAEEKVRSSREAPDAMETAPAVQMASHLSEDRAHHAAALQ
ncbi:hypothetical protein PInf_018565 [Phytophthora infestans]|nr:hypothetical protein PInf_018565 [Phytophthora infestans]